MGLTPEALVELIAGRLGAFRRQLGPSLGCAFDELTRRLGLDRSPDDPSRTYFLAPLTLPVAQLPRWVARAVAADGPELPAELVDDLVEAAVTGYLHVRVHDDLLDEGIGRPGEAMLLAEALFLRHQRLLAAAAGASQPFWDLFERRWLDYDEAMMLENDLLRARSGYDAEAFRRVLRRSRPLVLPAAAALYAADCGRAVRRLAELESTVEHLVHAHQLFHDLIDIEKDLRGGNHTYLVQRFEGDRGVATLRRRMFLEGGFDQVTAESLAELDLARSAAERAGMIDAVEAFDRRRELMEQTQRETFADFFDRILANKSGMK